MKKVLVIAIFCISSIAQAQLSSSDEVAPELVEKREVLKREITANYLAIKESLIISDNMAVISNSVKLEKSLSQFKFKQLSLDQMNEATKTRREILELNSGLKETSNIDEQRKVFETMSSKFWSIAEKLKAEDVQLNLQVCPMTGAMWLSDSKEIKNPYYPKNMLTCGEVKASI
ncbi:DUF3347 domain-containing protein [Aestuariibaculum sp. M13]|uniref:DUF3347 domain-containing protein n=1 Tax=Aestuariibaculum sp. M13 TaxID=2967132 RepID=UPI002159D64A|nr:DUF3347 domain-containing protein [Aestuariibaculum sp. M13]MCR8668949.1 DUF3347 domain-containing protein [Aestuariibaculum sp. M13]